MTKLLKVFAGVLLWCGANAAIAQVPIVGSTGSFSTYVSAPAIKNTGSTALSSPTNNTLNLGWNFGGIGEGDFYDVGNGTGGYQWYFTLTPTTPSSPIMSLTGAGALSVTTSVSAPSVSGTTSVSAPSVSASTSMSTPSLNVNNSTALSSPTNNTLGLGWNYGTGGESDFFDVGIGTFAYYWYGATSATAPSSPIMSLTKAGTLTVNQVNATVSGNASTASSLASTPSNCGTTHYSYGIASNGNAQCSTIISGYSSSITLPSNYGQCQATAITATGATTTMVAEASLTNPSSGNPSYFTWSAWVSAANQITVLYCNISNSIATPPPATGAYVIAHPTS